MIKLKSDSESEPNSQASLVDKEVGPEQVKVEEVEPVQVKEEEEKKEEEEEKKELELRVSSQEALSELQP